MKQQALFSSKGKSKKLKCRLLQFLFGTLKIKNWPELRREANKIGLFAFHERVPSYLNAF